MSPSGQGQDDLKVWSSQTACPPLQSPGFVPLGPGFVSLMSLVEFWVSAVVSVLMLLPGMQARACGNAGVAHVDSIAGITAELSCTSSHQDLDG